MCRTSINHNKNEVLLGSNGSELYSYDEWYLWEHMRRDNSDAHIWLQSKYIKHWRRSVNKCKDDITTNPWLTAMFRIRSRYHVVRDPVRKPVTGAWQVAFKEVILAFLLRSDMYKKGHLVEKSRDHPADLRTSPRRKIGLIEGNAKCLHINTTGGGEEGGNWTRKVRGATVHKARSKIVKVPTCPTASPVYKLW